MTDDPGGAAGGPDDLEARVGRALVAWVAAVERHARTLLLATAVITLAFAAYIATNLGVNASHRALLSDDLPFWRQYEAFAEVFPIVDEALFVVIEAETQSVARDAADLLAARLREEPERFGRVYVPGGGPFFERHGLLYLSVEELEDLADHLARIQPLLAELAQDRSLPNLARVLESGLQHAREEGATIDLAAVFDSLTRAARAVLAGNPRPVSWAELLLQRDVATGPSRQLILLEPEFDYSTLLPARDAIAGVHEAAREVGIAGDLGARVRVTGNLALNYEEMLVVGRQSLFAAGGSFVLVGAVLAFALGSRKLVVSVLLTLLVGLVWTGAFATFAVGTLNIISVAFAVLFIGLGVDFGIHLAMRYAELLREGEAHSPALAETARSVGGSLVLCALTTAIGFYVFVPTDYRAVAELGLIAGTGLPISLFCSLTVLPALLSIWRRTADPRVDASSGRLAAALVPVAIRRRRVVLAVSVVLAAISALVAIPGARFDPNVARLRDPSTESVQAFEDLLAESHTSPWTLDVMAGDLRAADAIAERLRALPTVDRAVTLSDYVPERQDEKLAILADLAFFVPEPVSYSPEEPPPPLAEQIAALRAIRDVLRDPELVGGDAGRGESARRAADQLGRFLERLEALEDRADAEMVASFQESLLGMLPRQLRQLWDALDPGRVDLESLPADLVEQMLAPDGRARVQVLPSEDLGDTAALARFVDGARAIVPSATGSALAILEWSRATVRAFQQALVSALVAVALVVWLLWRRPGDVALVLAPLVLAALLTVGTAVSLGVRFNFANVIVLPLLLGIGVDSGIHLVHRYREAASRGLAVRGPELLGTSTARAVLFSALTTMGSFGSLALSSHRGIASLGQLLLLGVSYTLACNLIVLPALLTRDARASRVPASQPVTRGG